MKYLPWTPTTMPLVVLTVALGALAGISLVRPEYTEPLFVHTTYYLLMVTVSCWIGSYLHACRDLRRQVVASWIQENWPGLALALIVTIIACAAIEPALRILSDEANLVGTSKNLFATKTATFTISGKNYYDSYWDIDVVVDNRPALFPFLVSLVHAVSGYSYKNAFAFNLLVLPGFVLVSYRLAKVLAGETFAVVASLLVVANPTTLLSVRSGGFDFLAAFVALLILKSMLDHLHESSPQSLAILWMNLCAFSEIRYEGVLFVPVILALLLLFRKISWSSLRPYGLIYALSPLYFLPRAWQAICRGSIPHQEPGAIVFSVDHFLSNASDYFQVVLEPFRPHAAHAALVILLGLVGCVLWVVRYRQGLLGRDWKEPNLRFALVVVVWMALQATIVLAYVWGRPQHPMAARLFIPIDTFFAFLAAWGMATLLARFRPWAAVLVAAAVFAFYLPAASQHRMLNRLTQTRESATVWRFFEDLREKRIVIVSDRPNLFTIMNYGAMSFETARQDPHLFEALARRLFYDIYIVQQVSLSTRKPLPGFEIWPERTTRTMLEFQNDADVLIRISRLAP